MLGRALSLLTLWEVIVVVFDDRETPSGQPDPAWHGAARHAVKVVDDHRYIVEVAIPWMEIGREPGENHTTLGIDFCVNGKDPQMSSRRRSA